MSLTNVLMVYLVPKIVHCPPLVCVMLPGRLEKGRHKSSRVHIVILPVNMPPSQETDERFPWLQLVEDGSLWQQTYTLKTEVVSRRVGVNSLLY